MRVPGLPLYDWLKFLQSEITVICFIYLFIYLFIYINNIFIIIIIRKRLCLFITERYHEGGVCISH